MADSVADRVSRNKQKLVESGGRILNTLRLKPEAAGALAAMEAKSGESATAIINQLLIEAVGNK